MKKLSLLLLGCCLALCQAVAQDADTATFRKWVLTPPMGWNSWDCYYSSDVVAYTTDGHAVDVDINWPEGSKTLVLGTMEATTSTTITAIGSIPRWCYAMAERCR